MKLRPPALSCLTAVAFVACGRMDLGAYAELPLDDAKDPMDPPAATSGASSAAGQPPSNAEGGATGAAAGGEGGAANAPRPARGAAGEAANEAGAGAVNEGGGGATGEGGATSEGGFSWAGATAGEITPPEKKSCRSLADNCGNKHHLRSCCEAAYVSSGEVVRGGIKEGEPPPTASRVSAFYLGVFEVTVGRFQAFLDDYDEWRRSGAPRPGDGEHPIVPSSGWRQEWLRPEGDPPGSPGLAADRATMEGEVSRCMDMPFSTATWLQPVNCVSFYEAQAFCIWDGGRLPTDLEWEYAAAGGVENRTYPWGADEPTSYHAMYGCIFNDREHCHIPSVGSFELGVGRFGQLDLAGSVAEWTLDTVGPAFPTPCHDCANVEQIYDLNPRSTRGGDWQNDASKLAASWTQVMPAAVHLAMHGIRCAYDAP